MKERIIPFTSALYLSALQLACIPPTNETNLEKTARGFIEALTQTDINKAANFLPLEERNLLGTNEKLQLLADVNSGCSIKEISANPPAFTVRFKEVCGSLKITEIAGAVKETNSRFYIDLSQMTPPGYAAVTIPEGPIPARTPPASLPHPPARQDR